MSGTAPTPDEIRAALVDAAECLRWAASNWQQIPAPARLRLGRCADRAERMVERLPGDGAP